MKKRYNLSLSDIFLIELSDILVAFTIIGILLTYFQTATTNFLINWKWAFLLIAIILAIKPARNMLNKNKKTNSPKKTTKKKK